MKIHRSFGTLVDTFCTEENCLHLDGVVKCGIRSDYQSSRVEFSHDKTSNIMADSEETSEFNVADPLDNQSEELQSPYIIFLKTEDNADAETTEDIQLSDFEFSESFPIESGNNDTDVNIKICQELISLKVKKDIDEILRNEVDFQQTYSCAVCQKMFNFKSSLKRHMTVCNHKTPFWCSICCRTFGGKILLKKHMRVHTDEKPYMCSFCDQSFAVKDDWKLHTVTMHRNEKTVVFLTNLNTSTQLYNLQHSPSPSNAESPISCSICTQQFSQKSILNRHMMIHTNEKPYSCTVCKRKFVRKDYLKKHMMIHIKGRSFVCFVCKETFNFKKSLQDHLIAHNGNMRPFSCSICDRSFSMSNYLKIHMLVHYKNKLYPCSICERSFTMKYHLMSHMQTHRNEKLLLYKCTDCPKKFKRKTDLNVHMKMHTKKAALKQKDLKKRVLVAQAKKKSGKRYTCPTCKKSFNLERNLKKHVYTHRNLRYFSCTMCKRSFSRKNHLERHITRDRKSVV